MTPRRPFFVIPPGSVPDPVSDRFQDLDAEYELLGEIGRGGSAVVYRAHDRSLGRDVALKVVRSSYLDDAEAVARLEREAKLVAALRHPHIVTLYGTRRLRDGSLALVMQYVPGRTLKQAIRDEGPMPVAVVEKVLREIASALDYANGRHAIVHRDIKPDNIYLDGELGHALVSDFGIARAGDGESSLTLAGSAIGTPAYMSPEQIDGEPLDGRTDLYSLGLVAYEMLTAHQPWAGHNLYTIIYKQKHEQLPPLRALRPDVPEYLQRALDGLLRKDRQQRCSDAGQFLAQLQPDAYGDARPAPAADQPLPELPAPVTAAFADTPTVRYARSDVPLPPLEPMVTAVPRRPQPARQTSGASPARVARDVSAALQAVAPRTPPQRTLAGRPRVLLGALLVVLLFAAGERPIARLLQEREAVAPSVTAPLPAALPARVSRAEGDDQVASAGTLLPVPVVVRVEDEVGEPVPGVVVEFQVLEGGGQVSSTAVTTNAAGLALVRWRLGERSGSNHLVAALGELPEVGFEAWGVPGRPARLAVAEGAGQEALRGTTLPRAVEVRVEDEHGNPVDGARVEFRVAAGRGSVDPDVVLAVAGVARTQWTLGQDAGLHTLAVQVVGTPVRTNVGARARYRLDPRPTLAAGGSFTCTLSAGGEAHCWGGNGDGQLGAGRALLGAGRLRVVAPGPLARLAPGVSHACALDRDGVAYCWGANMDGQLGTGDRESRGAPALVRAGEPFTSIVAGASHSCALTETGSAHCWGAASSGQIGDGGRSDRTLPTPVAGGHRFSALVAGWGHTCGLTRQQTIYCWGANGHGQLGDGTRADQPQPVRVGGSLRFVALSAGASHSCAITTDREAWCWGDLAAPAGESRPARVAANLAFTTVVSGAAHACGLTAGGQTHCWGRNNTGQLGNDTNDDAPAPVPIAGDLRLRALSAAGSHTCGRTAGGDLYCWGSNAAGQLGDGTRLPRPGPVRVSW
jgi:tRNA A-37 threonylcarbamoyl transferase component Bud32